MSEYQELQQTGRVLPSLDSILCLSPIPTTASSLLSLYPSGLLPPLSNWHRVLHPGDWGIWPSEWPERGQAM